MNEEITEILAKIDVEAYLDREGIRYKPSHGSSGPQFNVQECPFCGNDKWKVFMHQETGLGVCFAGSCEKRFNKYSFIRAHLGASDRDTIEHLKSVSAEMGWRPPRKSRIAVELDVKELKLPHSFPIPINGRNLAYLQNRNIGIDTAQYFHLRFCKKGLFRYQQDGNDRLMPFDMRIIIPVFDLDGNLVSFQGRDITGKAEKKYLFPPGFASTGEHLYNGHNVHHTDRVVVGEGAFDVAATKIALDGDPELRNVVPVGTFGKHLGEGQFQKFVELQRRGVKEVTLMWDGEIQATDDAIEAGMRLKGFGFRVRVAMLPKDKDPNEVAPEEVRRAYWGAVMLDGSSAIKIRLKRRG